MVLEQYGNMDQHIICQVTGNLFVLCFFGFISRFTTMNICSQFVFRYLAVVREIKIKWKHHTIILIISALPLMVMFVISNIINQPTPENEHLTNYELAKMLELDNYTINNYVVGYKISSCLTMYANILTFLIYAIIIFCGIRIQLYVRRKYNGPNLETTRKVNRQITIVLCTQVTLLTVKNYRRLIFKCNSANVTTTINNQIAHT
uniref:Uncharacterized protein n=1 Tax=Meloidogyne enterolobii TaxID=390850 RepID=A0A6V7VVN5_MELEN|nr:unnamed protein product [Meloidogyne enterolobii]